MATPFSIEDVGTVMCPPCPPIFVDDGRFFWVSLMWLILLLAAWPYRKLAERAPKQRRTGKILGSVIFFVASAGSVLTLIAFSQSETSSVGSSFGSFLAWVTGAHSAQACLGCADLTGTIYNLAMVVVSPLYLVGLISLVLLRRNLGHVVEGREPRIKPALWTLTIVQILMLTAHVLLLLIQVSS